MTTDYALSCRLSDSITSTIITNCIYIDLLKDKKDTNGHIRRVANLHLDLGKRISLMMNDDDNIMMIVWWEKICCDDVIMDWLYDS